MSKTYTRKVHKGEVQKKINAEEKKRQEAINDEQEEAARWADVTSKSVRAEEKKIKEETKKEHKEKLKKLYDEEMNSAQ